MRVLEQPAFVLHARNYSETSLILEVLTPQHGRLGLIAKGARRPQSRLRALLIPFQPLLIGFSGRGELMILTGAEAEGVAYGLWGEGLYCGFYLNELLVRLLHRHDPHEQLYRAYGDALAALLHAEGGNEAALRRFEKALLRELGYGLVLDHDVSDRRPIAADAWYDYVPERGPVRVAHPEVQTKPQGVRLRGESLLAFANDELRDPRTRREVKLLMRALLAPHLGDRPLHSRRLFRELNQLQSTPVGEGA